jgi:hypothetical protein
MEFFQIKCEYSLDCTEIIEHTQKLYLCVSGLDESKTVESFECVDVEGVHIRDFLQSLDLL